MIIFIIIGIALIIGIIHCICERYCYDFFDHCFTLFLILVVGVLVGFTIFLTGHSITEPSMKEAIIEVNQTQEIIAMKDNFITSGNRFITSGYVDKKLKYFYIIDTPRGRIIETVDANKSYIKYIGENETPYMEYWIGKHSNSILYWLFGSSTRGYTFYIPDGSVIENIYEINLE
jgi:hypothetical protein